MSQRNEGRTEGRAIKLRPSNEIATEGHPWCVPSRVVQLLAAPSKPESLLYANNSASPAAAIVFITIDLNLRPNWTFDLCQSVIRRDECGPLG